MELELQDKINLIFIYISEAHAVYEWPISLKYYSKQQTTIEERIHTVEKFKEEFKLSYKVYVDSFSGNNFESVYAGWSEIGYIIYNNNIEYITNVSPADRIKWKDEIIEWLKQLY